MESPVKIAFGSDSLKLKLDRIELPCYILENGQHVFTKDGIQRAMGYDGKSSDWLFEFLNHINRLMAVDPDLLESLSSNILFEKRLANGTNALKEGILPELLIDACKTIIKAKNEGYLFVSELKFAKAAETVLNHTKNTDTTKLIDYATGYDLYKQNRKDALFRFMKDTLQENYPVWVISFPDVFFETLFEFKEWEWEDLNENGAELADFFQDIIFSRIPDALLETLCITKPKMKYRKRNTPEQYLENPDLSVYLHSILALIKASEENENLFRLLIDKTFPKKRTFVKLQRFQAGKENPQPSLLKFNESLKKTVKDGKSKKP